MTFLIRTIVMIVMALTATSCGFQISVNQGNDFIIGGNIVPLNGLITKSSPFDFFLESSYATTCSSDVYAHLYQINNNGSIDDTSPLATQKISSDAHYQFSLDEFEKSSQNLNVQYLVKVTGCNDEVLKRPVTNFNDQQDVNARTTIVAETVGVHSLLTKTLNEANRTEVENLITSFQGNDISDALDSITTTTNASDKFTDIFGVGPDVIKYARPDVSLTYPAGSINELVPASFTLKTYQIDPSYSFAYSWKVDGVVKSTNANWTYIPSANDQGTHQIDLFVGSDDGSGHIDGTRPYYTQTVTVSVNNTILPTPPSVSIDSSTPAPRTTNNITLAIGTGTSFDNCASFSKMAITENLSTPGPLQFNIDCTDEGTQLESLSYSATEGQKKLYLWVQDEAGNVAHSSALSFIFDNTAPDLNLSTDPTLLTGGSTLALSWTSQDLGSTVTNVELLYAADGATFTSLQNITDGTSTFNFAVPSDNTTSAKLKLIATNGVGLTTTVLSNVFTIDSMAPSAPIVSLVGTTPSQSSLFSFTLSSCTDLSKVIITTTSSAPTLPDSGWTTCSTSAGGLSYTASGDGSRTLYFWGRDAAGNISTSTSSTVVLDTTAPQLAFTNAPTGLAKGGAYSLAWTMTEASSSSAQSFAIEYSTDNGSSWTSLGTPASLDGPLVAQAFTSSITLPSIDNDAVKLRLSFTDLAGNATALETSTFVMDSTVPQVTYTVVENDHPIALSPIMSVAVNATDNKSVTAVKFGTAGSSCQASFTNDNWQAFNDGAGNQNFNFLTTFSNGLKTICAWAKDSAGNVSTIVANGTSGVDSDSITLDLGSAPSFTNLAITNDNSSSPYYGTTTFDLGDTIKIEFTVTDDNALAENPISILYSTDNTTFTEVASNTVVGSPGTGVATWTHSYSGLTASAISTFRFRLISKDQNGNTSQISSPFLNSAKWSILAGNNDIGDGSSALAAQINLYAVDSSKRMVAANSKNEIFISSGDGIRKIDPLTGIISTYIPLGTENLTNGPITAASRITGSPDLIMDGNNLYLNGANTIYRINTLTNTAEIYAGGGNNPLATDPTDFAFWSEGGFEIDPVSKDLYVINKCIKEGPNSTTGTVLQKITQDPTTKAASTITTMAGNCNKGVVTDGSTALASPLDNTIYPGAHANPVYVRSLDTIYYHSYDQGFLKIKNGKIYKKVSYSCRSLIYMETENRVYCGRGVGIVYFTPNTDDSFSETVTTLIKGEGDCTVTNCRDDGMPVSDVGAMSSSIFRIGNQLGYMENSTNAGARSGRLRVIEPSTQTIQTIAGKDRFYGFGSDMLLANFSSIKALYYRTMSNTNYPAGLYVLDGASSWLLRLDESVHQVKAVAGTGVLKAIQNGDTFDTSHSFNSGNNTISSITTNPLGNLTVFLGGTALIDTDVNNQVYFFLYGTSSYGSLQNKPDGYTGSAASLSNIDTGTTYDSDGNYYFGTYYSISGNPPNFYLRTTAGAYYNILGTSIGDSVDCTTPGCVKSSPVNTLLRLAPFDQRYNSGEGRLIISDQNVIKYITKPGLPDESTLQTIVDVGRGIEAFRYTYVDPSDSANEEIDRFYYISSNGRLYCKKISAGVDPNCDNTILGPNPPFKSLSPKILDIDPDGSLYGVSSDLSVIYKYIP